MEEFFELLDVTLRGLLKTGDLLVAEEQAEHAANSITGHINACRFCCRKDAISKKFDLFATELSTRTPIVPAKLLNHAGIIGAALAARKENFSDSKN